MAETDDARTLISDTNTPMERAYADYANAMKALANKARVDVAKTGKIAYSKNANRIYSKEVKSLIANAEVATRVNAVKNKIRKANPTATEKEINKLVRKEIDIKKASQQALSKARTNVQSVSRKDRSIKITDREWEAIQAGAISENYLKKILNNSDVDSLRQRATPRTTSTLSQAKIKKAKAMSASNYSLAEIAKALGVSTSTVSSYLKE